MKKIKKLLLPVLFVGTLIIMSLMTFLPPNKTYSENEKRILAEFPRITAQSVFSGNFGKELETYISDHIPGRDMFVGVNAYFSYILGRNSLDDIYKAKDGYLINAPKEDAVGNFRRNMENIENFSKTSGIASTLMIIPTAGYIMEDKLPMFAKSYDDDELFKEASRLTPDINFLDVRGVLYDAYKDGGKIYYRTDHHLTSEGSYRAYKEYCRVRSIPCPDKGQYSIEEHDGFMGTTYSGSGMWLTGQEGMEIWDLGLDTTLTMDEKSTKIHDTPFFREHLKNKDMYPVFLDGNHGYVKIHNPHASEGNLLIIRDSFAQSMAPFMAYNYENIYMLDMRYYRGSMEKFLDDNDIEEILYLFGIDTLKTDSSTSWLMF